MALQFLKGVLAGTVVSGIGLAITSLAAPSPDELRAVRAQAATGAGQSVEEAATATDQQGETAAPETASDITETVTEAPALGAPPVTDDALPEVDSARAATPETAPEEVTLSEVSEEAETALPAGETADQPPVVSAEAPAIAAPAASQPPAADTDPAIDTPREPQQPQAPAADDVASDDVAADDAPAEEPIETAMLEPEVDVPAPAPVTPAALGAALDDYAVDTPFDPAKPMMSVVLIDTPESGIDAEALTAFPYPITIAIDAGRPDAAEAAAAYRAQGFEVLALSDLAGDRGAAVAQARDAVPEAVALIADAKTQGASPSRADVDTMIAALEQSGHGVILQAGPDDGARQAAARAGLGAATVFRDLDSVDQKPAVIRRFLDQAAFKAGQSENGVILVGRVRADTVSALLLWGLQDRASSVALVPASAVLKKAREG